MRKKLVENKERKKQPSHEFERQCCQTLYTAAKRVRKVTGTVSEVKWVPHFVKLQTEDKIDFERIKLVLDWYVIHITDRYTPKAYSAKGFRQKFLQIEAAMEQDEKQGVLFEDNFPATVISDDGTYEVIEINYEGIESENRPTQGQ